MDNKKAVKKSFSAIEYLNKPNAEILGESQLIENFETKKERMIHWLGQIKKKLKLIQDDHICVEIDWMIDTLLYGHLNDIVFTLDKENNDELELNKMLELLAEYSSEFNLQRNLENLQQKILQKKSSMSLGKILEFDQENSGILLNLSKHDLFTPREEIFSKDFNIFNFSDKVGRENIFYIMSGNIFNKHNLLDKIKVETFTNFLKEIKFGYKKENPYHNDLHAADVTQTCSLMLIYGDMINVLGFDKIDVLSFILSALVHDYRHTGQTNSYHINMQTDLALIYNDISTLENYHISETFKTLNKSGCNVFENYSKDERKILRKRIVDMILATDMSMHTKIFSGMKLKVETLNIESGKNVDKLVKLIESPVGKFDSKQEVMNYVLHAADISHNVKKFEITEKWTNLVMTEFWNQGDLEKENLLPVSFNCDRLTANVPKSQIGFLNGIIVPTFALLSQIFPSVEFLLKNSCENMEKWIEKCS